MKASEPPAQSARRAASRSHALVQWFDAAAGVIVSTSLAAMVILLVDHFYRPAWDFSWADHWMGAPILYLAPAALIGLLWAQVQMVQEGISRRFRDRPRRRDWIRAGTVAVLAALGAVPIAFRTFSGAAISRTWLGPVGPFLFCLAVAAGVFGCALAMWRVQRRSAMGQHAFGISVGCAYLAFGCGVLGLDMNAYVGLYDHLHTFLEVVAFALLVGGFQVIGFIVIRVFDMARPITRAVAAGLVALGMIFVSYRPLRTWTDTHLAHAWVDEVYVGRTLRRTQLMELQLSGGESLRVARMDHLARRFDVKDERLDPAWLAPVTIEKSLPEVRNIVFFYVDTLRADVALDPTLMPELTRLRAESVDFRRAYAAGSDTLRSLPTITRGNYFLDKTHRGDLLRLSKERGLRTRVILATSASQFLAKLLPTFAFDDRIEVRDYQGGDEIWGYGADLATAALVGDQTIEFLKSPAAKEPFFLWAFHFDMHAWREIEEAHIQSERQRLGVPERGDLDLRYRLLARTVDEQLGRTLDALRATGRDKDTAFVFLSDHGEGLGQGGFWVHSVFLWENLIHVPLVLKLPGAPPRVVEDPVSLVDLAPTLAPALGEGRAIYHGENLLTHPPGAPRRLPILLRAGEFQGHDRAGIIDVPSRRKLVLRLEAAFPELHAYETDARDERNLAPKEARRVRQLVHVLARSPVYPRGEEDFMLHSDPRELGVGGQP